jgi:hypothetical protein
MILELISIVTSFLIYFRASSLAQGKKIKKLFTKEGFLFWQKSLAIYIALWITYFIIAENIFYWFMTIALVLDGLFYLQPTPRTTKKLLVAYTIFSIISIFYCLS